MAAVGVSGGGSGGSAAFQALHPPIPKDERHGLSLAPVQEKGAREKPEDEGSATLSKDWFDGIKKIEERHFSPPKVAGVKRIEERHLSPSKDLADGVKKIEERSFSPIELDDKGQSQIIGRFISLIKAKKKPEKPDDLLLVSQAFAITKFLLGRFYETEKLTEAVHKILELNTLFSAQTIEFYRSDSKVFLLFQDLVKEFEKIRILEEEFEKEEVEEWNFIYFGETSRAQFLPDPDSPASKLSEINLLTRNPKPSPDFMPKGVGVAAFKILPSMLPRPELRALSFNARLLPYPKPILPPSKSTEAVRKNLAGQCHQFALRFLKDYILVSKSSAETPKDSLTPLGYWGKSIVRILEKPSFLSFLVNSMPEREVEVFPVSAEKTTLRVLKTMSGFFKDYLAAQEALLKTKIGDAHSPKPIQQEEILLIEKMNQLRPERKLDPVMHSTAQIDKYLMACLTELNRVIQNKNPDSSLELLDAVLEELPNIIFDHITFLLSPYFISVLIHHTLVEIQKDKAKDKEADSLKTSQKTPLPKPVGGSKKETYFDRELGVVLSDLIGNMIEFGKPSSMLRGPLKSVISLFKNTIAAQVHLGMESMGNLENLEGLIQRFTHFLWKVGTTASPPSLVPYFYKDEAAKEAVDEATKEALIIKVREEFMTRLNDILVENLPFGTQWVAATDFTKTLSQNLFRITQQPWVLKFMTATILEAAIELNKGNTGIKLLVEKR
jgi:hypothetical protein